MKFLILAISIMTLSACDKINHMMDMPDKMDSMNNKMDKMESMDKKMDKMDSMDVRMEKMASGMDATVVGINDQRVMLPFQQLMDEANYERLSPIPSQLMPWAQKFAQAIPAKDFAELTYLWLKEIREVNPPKDLDKEGNEVKYSEAQVSKINKVKLGRFYALLSVCGFLSDEKVNEIIDLHIKQYSRFEKTAYKILMMRAQFIRDILLNQSLLSEPLSTVGEFKESMMYIGQLDFIARLPFKAKINYKVDGFLAPMDSSVEEKLDPKMMLSLLKRVDVSIKQDFKVDQQDVNVAGTSEENAKIKKAQSDDFAKAMAQLAAGLQYWEANTPK